METLVKHTATRMHVAFALFEADKLLRRGSLLLTKEEGWSCYGEHRHYHIPNPLGGGNDKLEVVLFSGLVIKHSFEEPASPLEFWFMEVQDTGDASEPYRQRVPWHAALRMGVHASDDWESIDMGKLHTLGFRCTPMP